MEENRSASKNTTGRYGPIEEKAGPYGADGVAGGSRVVIDHRRMAQDGGAGSVIYLSHLEPLADYPRSIIDRLAHWAQVNPAGHFVAHRGFSRGQAGGAWHYLDFASALKSAESIGQALLAHRLDENRPVLILSGNDLEHAQLVLACLWAGVPYAAVSPNWSLRGPDFALLRHAVHVLTPGLVFASDGQDYRAALDAVLAPDCAVVLTRADGYRHPSGGAVVRFDELAATEPGAEVERAHARLRPDDIARFVFTSGSTGAPKAVVMTHRMWSANQQQLAQAMPVIHEQRPVLVDWLPWHHTFGGSHNFGIVLFHGGTLYIDGGKPTPDGFGESLRNLREIAPTLYFNVPAGFAALADALGQDPLLRARLFSRLRLFFCAGAGVSPPVWQALRQRMAHAADGAPARPVAMGTGLGMTESSPFALFSVDGERGAAHVGLPAPGLELKLADQDGQWELRYRGPNIASRYWRDPAATAAAFDEEGFLRSGDAVCWTDPARPHLGLSFHGRIAENFKLATGSFVNVDALRSRVVALGAPYVQDCVISGEGRQEVGALVFAAPGIRTLANAGSASCWDEVLAAPAVRAFFQRLAGLLAAEPAGATRRPAWLAVLAEAPSAAHGEITDKGSINQRAVLRRRSACIDALHSEDGGPGGALVYRVPPVPQ